MTEEQIYRFAERKQQRIIENNISVEYYKTDEFLAELIKDFADGLNFSKYCIDKNKIYNV